ncbi:MAG: biotin/lipoate A/B protein ligase family protein [Thermodesulfobacteriota bacterium]
MMEEWRLIIDPSSQGFRNMAADEALLRSASLDRDFRPVLRLYGWAEPTVSLGYLQKAAPFANAGLPVVRRITGGRALLHDSEFTYAVIAGADNPLYSMGIAGCYSTISRAIVLTLREFGIEADFSRPSSPTAYRKSRACFASSARYEVLLEGKKIAGSAQRRLKGGVLQHGSIIFGLDRELWGRIFGREVPGQTATVSQSCTVDVDKELFGQVFVEKVSEALKASFVLAGFTEAEESLKRRLIAEKYSRKEWNEEAQMPASSLRPGAMMALGGI